MGKRRTQSLIDSNSSDSDSESDTNLESVSGVRRRRKPGPRPFVPAAAICDVTKINGPAIYLLCACFLHVNYPFFAISRT